MTTRSKALRLKEGESRPDVLKRDKGNTSKVSSSALGINPLPSSSAGLEDGEALTYDDEVPEGGKPRTLPSPFDEEDDPEQEEEIAAMETFVLRADEGDIVLMVERTRRKDKRRGPIVEWRPWWKIGRKRMRFAHRCWYLARESRSCSECAPNARQKTQAMKLGCSPKSKKGQPELEQQTWKIVSKGKGVLQEDDRVVDIPSSSMDPPENCPSPQREGISGPPLPGNHFAALVEDLVTLEEHVEHPPEPDIEAEGTHMVDLADVVQTPSPSHNPQPSPQNFGKLTNKKMSN
ncbi:hypothetical protein U1Q18_025255 [Sarracenia purpurea var. burkii]